MKKEEIYVIIDSEEKRDRAIKILKEAGEPIWDSLDAMVFDTFIIYLILGIGGVWYVANIDVENKTEITLNQLEELLSKKELSQTKSFKKVTDSLCSLLEYKNKLYGNAVLEPLQIFSGKCKAGIRLDDKLSRIKNSDKLRKNDVSDLMGYLVLTCVENGWDNFDEFKD